MATLIAANSDSTLMNSQGSSAPAFTSSPRPSTMWVCGEIGYAQITSGRHRATACATACEPSHCSSIVYLHEGFLLANDPVRIVGGGDVLSRDRAAELFADGSLHGL